MAIPVPDDSLPTAARVLLDDGTRAADDGPDPDGTRDASQSTHPSAADRGGPVPVIPGYEIVGEIAHGGMGVVYAARDRAFDREVAVKTLLASHGAPDAAARFVREAEITGRLQHPGVPPVHHLGTLSDGRPFLAMKLIRGETLAALLKARPSPANDLGRFVRAFEQVAETVGFAHARGVVHRDLKPANVMVGEFGEVQVMDWGLAKLLTNRDPEGTVPTGPTAGREDETQAGAIMGTPSYMPPEQARGEQVGPRADVFALGGILCTVLTGRPPFLGGKAVEVIARSAAGDTAEALDRLAACGADPELVAVARQCLSADPADRYPDGRAVAAAVAAYRVGVEERLRRAEIDRTKAEEQRKRARARQAWAVAVAALLAAGGGFAWWSQTQAQAVKLKLAEAATEQARLEGEANLRDQVERDRVGREAERLAALIGQCEGWLREGDAIKAGLAFDEVQKRAGEGGAEAIAGRYARCRTDLATLRELDRVAELAWTVSRGRLLGEKRVVAELAQSFRRFGVVPGTTPVAAAAESINSSLVRTRLLYALDLWLCHEPSAGIAAVLSAADPDPFRTRVRAAHAARDAKAFDTAAADPDARTQPAWFTAALGSHPDVTVSRSLDLLRRAATERPSDFALVMTIGGTFPLDTGVGERIRWYQAAVGLRPTSAAAWNNLGIALYDAGVLVDAEAAFHAALTRAPDLPAALNALGSICERRNDLDRAEAYHRRAIAADPTFAESHHNLGGVYVRRKRPADAAACFREASRLDPNLAAPHAALADVLAPTDAGQAEAEWATAVRLAPDHAGYRQRFGQFLQATGQSDRAREEFRAAIRLAPDDVVVRNELGLSLLKGGNPRAALAEFEAAVALQPRKAGLFFNLGTAHMDLNDVPAALAAFRQELRIDPTSAKGQYSVGNCLHMSGDSAAAVPYFREAVRLDPNLNPARFALGSILFRQGKSTEAAAELKEVVRRDPTFVPGLVNYAFVLSKMEDFDGAVTALRAAARLAPKDARLAKLLQEALARKEQQDGKTAPPPRPVKE